jgi:hypothetical protein
MLRENLNPGSRHVSLFATPGKGIAFQRRTTENGISMHTAGPAITAPVWLKLQKRGDVVTAYYRKAITDFWTAIGSETFGGLNSDVLVGLAVTSHADGAIASATFSNVTLTSALPWAGHAIGAASGTVATDGVVFTATGKGADIWNTADAFFYVATRWANGVTITARVRSISNTHAWAKAGVMIRQDLTPGSAHVMAVVTPGRGVSMQYRPTPGGASVQNANVPGAAPAWVRLTLRNGTFTSEWSVDGEHWLTLGSVNLPFSLTDFYVGLPVTSHNTGAATTVVFDDVVVGPA